jgi:hypothetical protein
MMSDENERGYKGEFKGRKVGSQDYVYVTKNMVKAVLESLGGHQLDKNFFINRSWLEDGGFILQEVGKTISVPEPRERIPPFRRCAIGPMRPNFMFEAEGGDHPHNSSVGDAGEAEAMRSDGCRLEPISKLLPKQKKGKQSGSTDTFVPMASLKKLFEDRELYERAYDFFDKLSTVFLPDKKAQIERTRRKHPDKTQEQVEALVKKIADRWKSLTLEYIRHPIIQALKNLDTLAEAARSDGATLEELVQMIDQPNVGLFEVDQETKALQLRGRDWGLIAGVDFAILRSFVEATDGMNGELSLKDVRAFIRERMNVGKKGISVRWRWLQHKALADGYSDDGGEFPRIHRTYDCRGGRAFKAARPTWKVDLRKVYNVAGEEGEEWIDQL